MSSGGFYFDENSARRIANTVRALEQKQRALEARLYEYSSRMTDEGQNIRRGVTTTSIEFPTYPSDGCQFVVRFQDHEFDENQILETCPTLSVRDQTGRVEICRTLDGSYVPQDTQVTLLKIRGPGGRRWWIIPTAEATAPPELQPFILKDESLWMQPGERAKQANLLILNSETGLWAEKPGYLPGDPSTHFLLFDDFHRNMVGPGEVVWAKQRPFHVTGNPLNNHWDVTGSQGLQRWGKVDNDVACGMEGTFTVYRDTPVLYQPTEDCYGLGQKVGIPFCNARSYRRKLKSGEWVCFEYDLGQRKWYPVRDLRPLHGHGPVTADFCQSSQIALTSPLWTDWANDDCTWGAEADASTVENSLHRMAGESGDQVYFIWNERTGVPDAVQVQEHLDVFVEDVSERDNQGCPQLWRDRKYMVGHRSPACGVAPSGAFFNFVTVVSVEDIRVNPANPCEYQFRTRDLCVGSAGTPSAYQAFLTATQVSVLDGVAVSGSADAGTCSMDFSRLTFCAISPTVGAPISIPFGSVDNVWNVRDEVDGLYQDKRKVSVLCLGSPTAEQIVDYNTCPTGPS